MDKLDRLAKNLKAADPEDSKWKDTFEKALEAKESGVLQIVVRKNLVELEKMSREMPSNSRITATIIYFRDKLFKVYTYTDLSRTLRTGLTQFDWSKSIFQKDASLIG